MSLAQPGMDSGWARKRRHCRLSATTSTTAGNPVRHSGTAAGAMHSLTGRRRQRWPVACGWPAILPNWPRSPRRTTRRCTRVRAEVNEARAAAEPSLMAQGVFRWAARESGVSALDLRSDRWAVRDNRTDRCLT